MHTDWGQPCARGLRRQLERLSELGAPLYVTENGLYDNTDERRPRRSAEIYARICRANGVPDDLEP